MSECDEVNLENQVEMPRCSCYDWGKTGYLCNLIYIFFLFSKSFHRGHLLKYDPSCHKESQEKSQEETYPDPIKNIKTKTKLYIYKDKRKTLSSGIFKEELKESMEDEDILTDALEQLLDIKALLKAAVSRESDISLEPVEISSKRKKFTPFALPIRKILHVGRHGKLAQEFRKFRSVKLDSLKILFLT